MLTRAGVRYRSGREVKLDNPGFMFQTRSRVWHVDFRIKEGPKRYVAEGKVRLITGSFSGDLAGHSTEVGRMRLRRSVTSVLALKGTYRLPSFMESKQDQTLLPPSEK